MRQQINLDVDAIRHMYVDRKMTCREIAEQLQCSMETIRRRLESMNVSRRRRKIESICNHTLAILYGERWSVQDLGAYFNCSHMTIVNRLHELGLVNTKRKRTMRENLEQLPEELVNMIVRAYKSGNTLEFISRQLHISVYHVRSILCELGIYRGEGDIKAQVPVMKELYEKHQLSTKEIAIMLGVTDTIVTYYLKRAGVRMRRNRVSVDDRDIWRLYDKGRTIMSIAEELGCSYSTVRQRLQKRPPE